MHFDPFYYYSKCSFFLYLTVHPCACCQKENLKENLFVNVRFIIFVYLYVELIYIYIVYLFINIQHERERREFFLVKNGFEEKLA